MDDQLRARVCYQETICAKSNLHIARDYEVVEITTNSWMTKIFNQLEGGQTNNQGATFFNARFPLTENTWPCDNTDVSVMPVRHQAIVTFRRFES